MIKKMPSHRAVRRNVLASTIKERLSTKSKSPKVSSNSTELLKEVFPIVGIGGSAGALEVFQELLSHMPVDTGMAFVIIQHLDPTHESLSSEILARATKMPVHEIQEGLRIQPNQVYVIPPNCNLDLVNGVFYLLPRSEIHRQHLPLDFFFQVLAREQRRGAIGVVLSGTGSDGKEGLVAIKGEGGITLVQDPETAKYDGMPRSAIASGSAELILSPQRIIEELIRIAKNPHISSKTAPSTIKYTDHENEHFFKIFSLLRKSVNTDFTLYKRTTIQRRISRRMFLHKIEDMGEYAKYIETHPDEIKALFADILIHVTGFFRDAKVFEKLRTTILPEYLKNRDRSLPFRIWVPGCSTGEEAYSLAMTLMEVLDCGTIRIPLTIFATDVSENALKKARSAIYPESICKDVSEERLRRFFEKEEGVGFRIAKWLREVCLFSRHDVTRDPPFARLDMISCRNLLIYFDLELQKRVIPIFHYALNPNGLLLLGQSETINGFSNLFSTVDKLNTLFSKKQSATAPRLLFPMAHYGAEKVAVGHKSPEILPIRSSLQKELEQISISRYVPPCVVVNESLDIIESRGRTTPFLALSSSGHPSLNLLRMAHPELIVDLRMALQVAKKKDAPITKVGLYFHEGGKKKTLKICVIPIYLQNQSKERYFSIFFEETNTTLDKQTKLGTRSKNGRLKMPPSKSTVLALALRDKQNAEMQKKLSENLEYQQLLITQHENTQEELIASNEELQSTNEELQSTNEELETAKEELQSSNEELTTVNDEIQSRNSEITRINNDLNNLLTSVNIPIVMIGHDRRIRRFTPTAEKVLKLVSTDIGRLIGDIRPAIEMPDLDQVVTEVMNTIMVLEFEVQDQKGHWYLLQIRPYRTAEDKIDGALIALLDIEKVKEKTGEIKRAADELKKSRDDALAVLQAQTVPLLVIGWDRRIKLANKAFCQKFRVSPSDAEGKSFDQLGEGQWNIPVLLQKIQESLSLDIPLVSYEVACEFPHIGKKIMSLDANKVRLAGSAEFAILVSILDITEQKEIENERLKLLKREQLARAEAEKANLVKDEFLAVLSHELRTPLTTILSWSQMLRMGRLDAEKSKRGIEILEESAKIQGQLIDDLLDVSRIQAGKLKLERENIDPRKIISAAIDSVRNLANNKHIDIRTECDPAVTTIYADSHRIQQIIWNLLTNAIKFSNKNGIVLIKLDRLTKSTSGPFLRIQVLDNGQGIKPDFLSNIFKRFSQADTSMTRAYGGLGLGLAIVRELVEMHGGTVEVESPGEGKGANFIVCLPIRLDEEVKAHEAIEAAQIVEAVEAAEAAETTEAVEAAPTSLQSLSILLVEDERRVREVLSVLLKSYGANVVSSESAKQALTALKEFEPDIIISDIAMPEEDGYALIKKIRTISPKLGQIPAIALTAYAGKEDIKLALMAGFQAHVAKPVDTNKLVREIDKWVGRKRE